MLFCRRHTRGPGCSQAALVNQGGKQARVRESCPVQAPPWRQGTRLEWEKLPALYPCGSLAVPLPRPPLASLGAEAPGSLGTLKAPSRSSNLSAPIDAQRTADFSGQLGSTGPFLSVSQDVLSPGAGSQGQSKAQAGNGLVYQDGAGQGAREVTRRAGGGLSAAHLPAEPGASLLSPAAQKFLSPTVNPLMRCWLSPSTRPTGPPE